MDLLQGIEQRAFPYGTVFEGNIGYYLSHFREKNK